MSVQFILELEHLFLAEYLQAHLVGRLKMARQLKLDFEPKPERLLSPDEIYSRADENLLRKLAEDRRIERKTSAFTGSNLGETICMWANTSPDGGLVVSGMEDDGAFSGCNRLSSEQINKLEKSPHNFCPDAKVVTKRVPVRNRDGKQDFVLLFRVEYHPDIVVKTTSGKSFVRRGDSKFSLKPEEIRELQADKGEFSFEQRDCSLAYPADFDEQAIGQFVAQVREERRLSEDLSDAEVLDVRHLGRIEGGTFVPNYACALLFAKDPLRLIPGCKVRFQRFEGEQERTGDKYNAVKDMILEGPIPSLIEQIEGVLDSQLRTFSPLDVSGKFFPMPEYPKVAWYEAIVNACAHRSYGNGMKNMPIFVKMFDDRLVVESPGPFPPFVTPENIYDMHQPRNPQLMDALFYLKFVKCAHEGTQRIRDTMAKMKLPKPEFRQSEIGHSLVRVTLRNNIKQRRTWIDQDVSQIVSEALAADLSENEKRVLNWVAVNQRVSVSDANKLLDLSWQSAKQLLLGLAKKRVLQYVRFKPLEHNVRDQRAFFRLRSDLPLPDDSFEQVVD